MSDTQPHNPISYLLYFGLPLSNEDAIICLGDPCGGYQGLRFVRNAGIVWELCRLPTSGVPSARITSPPSTLVPSWLSQAVTRGLSVIRLVEVSRIHVTRSSAVSAPGPLFENCEPDVWRLDLGRILFFCFSKQSQRLTEVSGCSMEWQHCPSTCHTLLMKAGSFMSLVFEVIPRSSYLMMYTAWQRSPD